MNEQRREAIRAVAEAAAMSSHTPAEVIARAVEVGLSWPDAQAPTPPAGRPRRARDPERSMWQDAAADLLVSGIALVRAARRAHTADDPWVREAEAWLGRAEALTGAGVLELGLRMLPGESPLPRGGRWSCGCPQEACELRWERYTFRDPADESAILDRLGVRCETHDLGSASTALSVSEEHRVRVQRVQALHELDLKHGEQCR